MNREELAYAGGLFEGEGWLSERRRTSGGILTGITMTDKEPLERFIKAVGLGRVRGPYKNGNNKSIYKWQVFGFEKTQTIIAMLWPWLGPRRRARAKEILHVETRA